MNPNDFDMDAELIPTDLNASSYGFMLRSRDGQGTYVVLSGAPVHNYSHMKDMEVLPLITSE